MQSQLRGQDDFVPVIHFEFCNLHYSILILFRPYEPLLDVLSDRLQPRSYVMKKRSIFVTQSRKDESLMENEN